MKYSHAIIYAILFSIVQSQPIASAKCTDSLPKNAAKIGASQLLRVMRCLEQKHEDLSNRALGLSEATWNTAASGSGSSCVSSGSLTTTGCTLDCRESNATAGGDACRLILKVSNAVSELNIPNTNGFITTNGAVYIKKFAPPITAAADTIKIESSSTVRARCSTLGEIGWQSRVINHTANAAFSPTSRSSDSTMTGKGTAMDDEGSIRASRYNPSADNVLTPLYMVCVGTTFASDGPYTTASLSYLAASANQVTWT